MTASSRAEATIRKSQLLIRIASVVFIIAALLILGFGVMAFLSLGTGDAYPAPAGMMALLSAATLAIGAFYLVTGIFGLRTARDRFKVKPYCILSVILAVIVFAEQALAGYSAVGSALDKNAAGIITLAFCVLTALNAMAALSLAGYNRRCPQEGVPTSAPTAPVAAASASQPAPVSTVPLQLRISSKFGSILHDKMEVLDAADNVVYRVHSKAVSLADRTFVEDADGNEVASIHAKVVSLLHGTYYVDMADGVSFEMSQELMHIKDVINIDALGWQLRGSNILEFSFDILDAADRVVATCKRHLVDVHDTYELAINDTAHIDEVVAIFVVLRHIMEHRAEAAAGGGAH